MTQAYASGDLPITAGARGPIDLLHVRHLRLGGGSLNKLQYIKIT